jgi:hypothetical protein
MNPTIGRALKQYAQSLEQEQQQLRGEIESLREELQDASACIAIFEGAYRDFMQHRGTLEYEHLKSEIAARVEQQLQDVDDGPADEPEFRIWVRAQSRGDAGEQQQSPEAGSQERGACGPTDRHIQGPIDAIRRDLS